MTAPDVQSQNRRAIGLFRCIFLYCYCQLLRAPPIFHNVSAEGYLLLIHRCYLHHFLGKILVFAFIPMVSSTNNFQDVNVRI